MVAVALEEIFATLDHPPNDAQRAAIEAVDGPLRIIAAPGSGKTHVLVLWTHALVLRTLNLLVCHDVPPERVVVITFTEKAAAELEERLRLYAGRIQGLRLPLAEINIGTIHWFCGSVRTTPEGR